jgi:DNA-binding beta-propeller fold protein YncE
VPKHPLPFRPNLLKSIDGSPARATLSIYALPMLLGLLGPAASTGAERQPSGLLLAANEQEGTLSIIDPTRNLRIGKVVEGGFAGHEVASSPDGHFAYVPIYGDGNAGMPGTDGREVMKLDLASRKVVGRYRFDHGVRPHAVVLNQHDGLLYVTSELDRTVSIIDPKRMTWVGAIPTGQSLSHMLVISHDGRFGYTSNIEPGSVSVLDIRARKLLAVVPVSAKAQRIAISTDDRLLFTTDQTKPRVAVISTNTRQVIDWIPLPAVGMGLTTTADGHWLLVPMESTSQLAIVALDTLTVVRTIDLPPYPHEAVLSPDGKTAYVSCSVTGEVVGLRTNDWTVVGKTESGPFVDGLAWAPRATSN